MADSGGADSEKLDQLEARMRQLTEQLTHIEAVVAQVRRSVVAIQTELNQARKETRGSPEPATASTPSPKSAPIPIGPPRESSSLPHPDTVRSKYDWEALVGGNWFNKIGITAIILGIAFFLRYAIENEWIGNRGKVILGLVTGLLFIAAGGKYQNQSLKVFTRGLIGGGVAILYLSLYFAFQIYQLLSQPLAFGLMVLVTAGTIHLSLRFNSRTILLFAMFGGFFTPFWVNTGVVRPAAFFTYIAILDLALVGVAWRQNWKFINGLCFLATAALYFGWYGKHYTASQFWLAEAYLTIFYLIFAALAFLLNLVQRKPADVFDALAIAGNAFFYFLGNLALLKSIEASNYHGLFTAFMAALYCGFSWLALRRHREDKLLEALLLGTAVVFFTLIFPIQFKGEWVMLAWLIEAFVLLHAGAHLRLAPLRSLALAVWVIALLALIGQITKNSGARLEAAIFTVFAIALLGALISVFMRGQTIPNSNERNQSLINALEVLTLLLLPFLLPGPWDGVSLLVIACVLIFAEEFSSASLKTPPAVELYFVPLAAFLIFLHEFNPSWPNLESFRLILNSRFLLYGGAAAVLIFYLQRQARLKPAHGEQFLMLAGLEVIGLLFAALTLEVTGYYDYRELASENAGSFYAPQHLMLSLVWALYSLALLILGIWKQLPTARFAALGIFALTILKVAFVDFWLIEKLYRIISAIAFGGILVYASYLYQRHRDKILAVMTGKQEDSQAFSRPRKSE